MQSLIQAVHSLPSAMSIDRTLKFQKHCYTSSKINEGPQIQSQYAARENITIVLEGPANKEYRNQSNITSISL